MFIVPRNSSELRKSKFCAIGVKQGTPEVKIGAILVREMIFFRVLSEKAAIYHLTERHDVPAHLIMLTMSKHQTNMTASRHLRSRGYEGCLAALAHFDEQVDELRTAGGDADFNFYNQVVLGFAERAGSFLERSRAESLEG